MFSNMTKKYKLWNELESYPNEMKVSKYKQQ